MPAKKLITKENILEAALYIVREKGMDALNMRSLAKRCNCSTQPIYLSFSSAEELKSEVGNIACKIFNNFIEKQIALKEYPEYKSIGMGYIKFALEEKELFKYLFMRNRTHGDDFEKDSYDKSTFVIMRNYGLYKDDAYKLHSEMWIFVHGIATMMVSGYLNWGWETVSQMLTDVYLSLVERIKKGENE